MIRLPYIKTLSRVFSDPKRARQILEMTRAELIENCPAAAKRDRESWHPHKTFVLRLDALNEIEPGLCGAESFQTRAGEYVEYLNAGDTYTPTLIYFRGRYSIGAWGDIAERLA